MILKDSFICWDRENRFELSLEDIIKIETDVLVIRSIGSVSKYLYKNFEIKNSIRTTYTSIKINHNQNENKIIPACFTVLEYDGIKSRYVIDASIPIFNTFKDSENKLSKSIRDIFLNTTEYSVKRLDAKKIVFCFPGFDVFDHEQMIFSKIVSNLNSEIWTTSNNLQIAFAIKQDSTKIGNYIDSEYITKRIEFAQELKKMQQESSCNDKEFAKKIISDYLKDYKGKQAKLAHLIDCDKSIINRYRKGIHIPKDKNRMIALALAMELNQRDMYIFMNGVGFDYPSDARDNMIERYIIQYPNYTFEEISSSIESIFPDKPIVPDRYGIEEKETKRVTSKEDIQ